MTTLKYKNKVYNNIVVNTEDKFNIILDDLFDKVYSPLSYPSYTDLFKVSYKKINNNIQHNIVRHIVNEIFINK